MLQPPRGSSECRAPAFWPRCYPRGRLSVSRAWWSFIGVFFILSTHNGRVSVWWCLIQIMAPTLCFVFSLAPFFFICQTKQSAGRRSVSLCSGIWSYLLIYRTYQLIRPGTDTFGSFTGSESSHVNEMQTNKWNSIKQQNNITQYCDVKHVQSDVWHVQVKVTEPKVTNTDLVIMETMKRDL